MSLSRIVTLSLSRIVTLSLSRIVTLSGAAGKASAAWSKGGRGTEATQGARSPAKK